MCAEDAAMCAKDAAMCAKDAAMPAKDAAMCAKDAAMCSEDIVMRDKDAAMCTQRGHPRQGRGMSVNAASTCANATTMRAMGAGMYTVGLELLLNNDILLLLELPKFRVEI